MTKLNKLIHLFILIFLIFGCTEKISYSGKILSKEPVKYKSLNTKQEVIENLGMPSYIDPIEKKYYYFTEKIINTNFFDVKLDSRKLIVFNFNIDESINSVDEYNLQDQKNTNITKDTIPNNLIKQGLVENIFGGVGRAPTQTNW